ncbi:MAG: methyltransferase family protein [Candidatus Thorarchaeota archaeon]
MDSFIFLLLTYLFLFIYVLERSIFAFCVPIKYETNEKKWLTVLPSVSYVLIFFISVFEFSYNLNYPNYLASFLGCVSLLVGTIFRYSALRSFQKNNQPWVNNVEPKFISRIVKNGIYKTVKHPYYISVILELLGISLILNTYISIAAIIFIQVPFLWKRIVVEEALLTKKFGECYISYLNGKSLV